MPTRMFNRRPPFLVFNEPEANGSSNPPAPLTDEQFLEQNGFPRNTATDDMTPDQKAAYWRNESKKHQADAKAKDKDLAKWSGLGDFDTISQSISDADEQRRSALSDQQKAVEDAEKSARSAGYAEARDKFAKPALQAILVNKTKGAAESDEDAATRVNGILAVLDVQAFIGDDGGLDAAKVDTFAQSLAPKDGNGAQQQGDPLADVLRRQQESANGHAGSVASMEAEIYKRLAPSK